MATAKDEEDIEMKPMVAAAASEEGTTPEPKPVEPDPVLEAISTQSAQEKLSIKLASKGGWGSSDPVTLTWHLTTSLSDRLPMSIVQVRRPGNTSVPYELHVDGELQEQFSASDDTKILVTKEFNGKKLDLYSMAHSAEAYGFMIAVDDIEVCSGDSVRDVLFSFKKGQVISGLFLIFFGLLVGGCFFWLTGRWFVLLACTGAIITGIGLMWRGGLFSQYECCNHDHCKWMMTRV